MAGQAKGRTLQTPPKDVGVRPILARIKKSLFDIVRPRLSHCRFLDLYAGTGAVGLEALSRGVASTTFVERDSLCFQILEENVKRLGFEKKATLIRRDATEDLSFLSKPFDLIFMGPPYKDNRKNPLTLVSLTLLNIARSDLLAPNGLIVAQHHKKEPVELPSEAWAMARTECYGDTLLRFIQKAP